MIALIPARFRLPAAARRLRTLSAAGVALALLCACGAQPPAGVAAIDGRYSVVSRLQPHSLARVRVEVAISFHCPACRRFQPSLDALQAKYGARLQIEQSAIAPRSGSGRAERLFLLAKRAGLAAPARDALYRARFELKQDLERRDVLDAIARRIGLPAAMLAQLDSPELRQQQTRLDASARGFAAATPAVLVEDQLLVEPDAAEVARVIDGLLAPGRR